MGMFYGFKLHAIVDERGLICRFQKSLSLRSGLIAPANIADQEAGRCMTAEGNAFILGDANYHGCGVHAQPKANFKRPKLWGSAFSWMRKAIETVFSSLVRSRNLALVQLNSFRSVRAATCRKLAAHNLAWFLLH